MGDTLIHIHIKRTGGTTLQYTLEKYVGAVARVHTVAGLGNIFPYSFVMVQGHFCWGVHKVMGVPSPRYFTFMRHPVERVLSVLGSNPMMSEYRYLAEKIETGGAFKEIYSSVVQLAGVNDFDNWRGTPASPELLEVAKQHLREMEFVGFTKHYRKSIDAMCQKYGWDIPELVTGNRATYPIPTPDEESNLYKAIAQRYPFACELYQWAESEFLGKII